MQSCMTNRMIAHNGLLRVAQAFVERWRLEAVRRNQYHLAALTLCMFLDCDEKGGTNSAPAHGFIDPKVWDVAATAPSVAADSCSDRIRFVSLRSREIFPIEITGCLRVEPVDPVGEKRLDLGGFTNADDDWTVSHDV